MKLWRRASGVLKDTNSVIAANLTRRSSVRNPDVEAAVVKATSHDDASFDARSCQKIYKWIALSPSYITPFAYAITARMDKTRSWVVALKGLILIHGVFCLKVPAVLKFGRLPFDLSDFSDGHDDSVKTWAHNAFVRAYYAFLDKKSGFMASELKELQERHKRKIRSNEGGKKKMIDLDIDPDRTMFSEIERLQKMQSLVDMLMQIKPQTNHVTNYVVMEAMDCCLTDICDIYSRICHGIAKVLTKISTATKLEASLALRLLEKSNLHADELSLYFEYCKGLGILTATDCPEVNRIPWEDVRKIERIVSGVSDYTPEVEKAIVVSETAVVKKQEEIKRESSESNMQTVVTTNWVFFEERDLISFEEEKKSTNPFVSPPMSPRYQLVPYGNIDSTSKEIPDLISFS